MAAMARNNPKDVHKTALTVSYLLPGQHILPQQLNASVQWRAQNRRPAPNVTQCDGRPNNPILRRINPTFQSQHFNRVLFHQHGQPHLRRIYRVFLRTPPAAF
jgi:hypothetical protein